jgi:hypothetical protein
MAYHDESDTMQMLWKKSAEQLSRCEECVQRFHEALVHYEEEFEEESASKILSVLKRLNAQRIETIFREVCAMK